MSDENINKLGLLNLGINRFFQLLTPKDNKLKSKDEFLCQNPTNGHETRFRAYPLGLLNIFKGGLVFKDETENNKGIRCEGCFWYNPFSW